MAENLKLLKDVPDKSKDEEFIKQIQSQLEGAVEKNTAFVGFQGKWGGGKSTLIRSLKGYIQYLFSMWSSNSQHLRRDFLVGLAEEIGLKKASEKIASGQDLPPAKGCQKCGGCILKLIVWVLFTLFIFGMWTGIGEVFYNLLKESPLYPQYTDFSKWGGLIGLSLLTVFIFLIYSKCDISSIFSIFGFKAIEPSSDLSDVQFEKYFCQLIAQNTKPLLIVMDNADRMLQGQAEAGISFLYLLKDIIDKYQQADTFWGKLCNYFSYNNTNGGRVWGNIAVSQSNFFSIDRGLYLLYNILNTSKPQNLKINPQALDHNLFKF